MPKKVTCTFCNKKFGCRIILDHYGDCLKNIHADKSGYLVRFFSHGITGDVYFIYAIVGLTCKFSHIDTFLRNIWCECCGHMSTFDEYHEKSHEQVEIKNSKSFDKYKDGDRFIYQYDMGTTTEIFFEILKKFDGKNKNNKINILMRNEPPKILCSSCKITDALFFNMDETEPICELCSAKNNIDNDMLTKITNSPRTGMCGYG